MRGSLRFQRGLGRDDLAERLRSENFSGTDTDYEYRISEGTEGIRETMAIMRKIVRQCKADPAVIAYARSIIARVPQKDWSGEVRAIFNYVRDRVRYTLDPAGVETLSTPLRLMQIGQGDCDDKSVALASFLEATGHPTRFKAVGFNGGELSHVYVETLLGTKWVPLDATELGDVGELAFNESEVKNKYVMHN